ncbi:alpha-amylase-like [Oppia nitens]|uniref:alpha-amylase-like n=1 Tax=Oppia nitens TaxID=1686743 RepID=UPI0023DAD3BF|nr:alpha-amylase-like [Oppia nitens]
MLKTTIILSIVCNLLHAISGSPNSDPHFVDDRSVIVQLFEWRFDEIAKECEIFLGPYGYGGVQVSPVHECAILTNRPWWERYQPIGYKIASRSGNEEQFRDMVHRCNKVGVRVYVDIVLNHMSMPETGRGTAGDTYDGVNFRYDAVPYNVEHFHGHESCPNSDLNIHNSDNPTEARNCQMGGLRDLNQGKEYVRQKQSEFLNKLIDIGVAGFRSDASQHQWPQDLQNIISRLHNLNTDYFSANSKPLFYHEYIEHGPNVKATEYTPLGRVIEFKYYENLGNVFRKLHNQKLCYLKNFGEGWAMLPSQDSLVMINNHDLQRGHAGDLSVTITFFEPKLLKLSTAYMLAWPYSISRVMSSYYWPRKIEGGKDTNSYIGPPHDGNYNIADVKRNADLSCDSSQWICEHRWSQIYNMVKFRNVAVNEPVANWWDFGDQIAFSRGNKAFIAINNDNSKPINQLLKTGLPGGTYCDIISGNLIDGKCTGRQIVVNNDSTAQIVVESNWDDPMIAFHIKSKL